MPKLRPFQREDVNALKKAKLRAILASSMGTGKTIVAVRAVAETYKRSLPALVVCPASVTLHWEREFKKWAPGIRVVQIEGMDGRIPRFRETPCIYVMSWALLDARWAELYRVGLKTIIADEAHFSKNPDALRSQALYRLTRKAPHLLLLSGTPIINTRSELEILKSLFHEDEPLMIRRHLEDVAPDIPQKKRSYLHIKLRDRHLAEYAKADDDFEQWLRREKEKLLGEGMAEYEVERALAAEALAKIGYLRRLIGKYKVPAALDWIARAVRVGEPVVVFLEHQDTLRRLRKGLKKQRIRHVVLEGSTSAKKRQAAIDAFQRHEYPVFIGTKAAKEGITLTAARHLLFLERFYTSAEEEQAEDRIRRIGQQYQTTIWFLHALGTIDDRVDTIVRTKRRVIRAAIGAAAIAENPLDNVRSMIRQWDQYVVKDRTPLSLGLGDPLPALPRPKLVHGIVFYGKRWKKRSAYNWCKMHGYEPENAKRLKGRLKLVLNPADVFVENQFDSFRVCKDVRIITGTRLSRTNERRVRLALRAAR